jgi:hypothetical protein
LQRPSYWFMCLLRLFFCMGDTHIHTHTHTHRGGRAKTSQAVTAAV